jgi:hypothetical protein
VEHNQNYVMFWLLVEVVRVAAHTAVAEAVEKLFIEQTFFFCQIPTKSLWEAEQFMAPYKEAPLGLMRSVLWAGDRRVLFPAAAMVLAEQH